MWGLFGIDSESYHIPMPHTDRNYKESMIQQPTTLQTPEESHIQATYTQRSSEDVYRF